jgi:protein O-mannosyl-transferase
MSPAEQPHDGTSRRAEAVVAASIGLVTLLAFLPALRNGFLAWDDAGYVTENVHIRTLSAGTVGWAFSEFHCNYWAPFTWLSLAVDHALWGLDPAGFHLTNVVLHAANAALVVLLALRLLSRPGGMDAATGAERSARRPDLLAAAAFAALLFSVHPLRVESVAWVTERKDVLSLFFGLLAALAYLAHARSRESENPGGDRGCTWPAGAAYFVSLSFYAASLLSKSVLVTLPAVLLVLDWFPLARHRVRGWKPLLLEKIPYVALAGVTAVVTAAAHRPQTKSLAEIDLRTRVLVAFESLAAYLRLTILPLDVSPVYMHSGNVREITPTHVTSIVMVLAITVWCAWNARRRPAFAAAWAVFVVTIGPVLGLLQNGPQSMAGRFTYVPSIAAAVVAGAGFLALRRGAARSGRGALVLGVFTATVLACQAALTVRDISFWRDDVALWTRSIELRPNASGRQYFNRALGYRARGEWALALSDFDRAYAIAAAKGYRDAHEIIAGRARVLRDMGDARGAIAEFERATAAAPPEHARTYRWELAELRRTTVAASGAADVAPAAAERAASGGGR